MSAIGGIVFCEGCGNLLPESRGSKKNMLKCECCGLESRDIAQTNTISTTTPGDFPSALRQKLHTSIQTVEKHKIDMMPKTQEKCPKCGAYEVRYTTLQLRSADEGSTVLYFCDCGHRWNQNN
ncbi:unnamed protein product [Parascedosporium putredinis]|uniref:DNA-directed RNA polymerase subunit n=1 Tax=Parascedosporium putredinis TaxID=1442378 RepID=A0A9P1H2Q5_9PEZI|nr:unnamed protein product [Parascedosporium putredinis]CAI7995032.1 unnamed protein product [Parascedosporium putredinis]